MKQTAVEWYFTELWNAQKDKFIWHIILEKAKEMEKEQMKEFYQDGLFNGEFLDGEGYYNETYGDDT